MIALLSLERGHRASGSGAQDGRRRTRTGSSFATASTAPLAELPVPARLGAPFGDARLATALLAAPLAELPVPARLGAPFGDARLATALLAATKSILPIKRRLTTTGRDAGWMISACLQEARGSPIKNRLCRDVHRGATNSAEGHGGRANKRFHFCQKAGRHIIL